MNAIHMFRTGKFSRPRAENSRLDDPLDLRISNYIPGVELKGSRTKKLATLDDLIVQLEAFRARLAGEPAGTPTYEGRSRYITSPDWPWFTAGVLLGALFVVMLIVAHGWR